MVPVRDISTGGLTFKYTKNLGFNSLLDFKIDIPLFPPTINCVGKIIRVAEPQPHSMAFSKVGLFALLSIYKFR